MSGDVKAKVPVIRFAGFNIDWVKDYLGNRVKFFSGLTYSPSDVIKESGTLVLRSSNIQGGEIVGIDNVYVKPEVVNCKNVEVGDIVVVVRNGSRNLIGKHAMVKKEMENTVIGAFMTGISSQTPEFINALLNTTQFNFEVEKNLGATINQITTGSFRNMNFHFINGSEAEKIGDFFKHFDGHLNYHQTQLDKLSNLKQAMLQKMFPQGDAVVPEIRFRGFAGEWKQKQLGLITEPISSNTLSRAGLNYQSGQAKNIHYGDILIKFGEILEPDRKDVPFISSNEVVSSLRYARLITGDIVFADAAEDETVGKCVELVNSDKRLVFSGLHTITFRPKISFATGFLGYYLNSNSYRRQLLPLMQGTKVLSLSRTSLASTYICFPDSQEEQLKIGNYFRELDRLIILCRTQMDKLEKIKLGCLGGMFV